MTLDSATLHWAYEELPEFPEDDGHRYEYIAGELVVTRFSSVLHQEVLGGLLYTMLRHAKEHTLGKLLPGPVGVLFGVGDYMAPDLVFVRADRRDIIGERAIEGVPDLIVEVVHPVTEARDRGIKRERYALYGVPEYWVVDPFKLQIERYRPAEDPSEAIVMTSGMLEWQPVQDSPPLLIDVAALFTVFD